MLKYKLLFFRYLEFLTLDSKFWISPSGGMFNWLFTNVNE